MQTRRLGWTGPFWPWPIRSGGPSWRGCHAGRRRSTNWPQPFDITKQAVSKHIQVLEQAGLVTRSRDAQRRPVHLDAAALERLTSWIDRYRLDAERNYRRLDDLLATIERGQGEATMTNALNLIAPVDTLAMDFTREFAAPREALFRAHAEPDLVKQWLGPASNEMTIDRWDFRTGGGYRYLHLGPDGGEYWFNGVYHGCGTTSWSSRRSSSRARRHGQHRVHAVRGTRRRSQLGCVAAPSVRTSRPATGCWRRGWRAG